MVTKKQDIIQPYNGHCPFGHHSFGSFGTINTFVLVCACRFNFIVLHCRHISIGRKMAPTSGFTLFKSILDCRGSDHCDHLFTEFI